MAIRALSLGKPLVVSDVGWFAELPDAVAAKVPVDEFEVETLTAVLERFAEDDDLLVRMGAAAAEYAREEHGLDRVADLYVAALEEGGGKEVVRDSSAPRGREGSPGSGHRQERSAARGRRPSALER